MTKLAWGMLVVLGGWLVYLLNDGQSVIGILSLAALLAAWVVAGWLVRRDARRLGYEDPDLAGGRVVVLGLVGLVWWFGYRRGRADANR